MRFIPVVVTQKVALTLLKTQKHSPAILFAAGVAGVVTTVVLASKATLKLEEVLEETNKNLENINEFDHSDYTDKDRLHDKAVIYSKAVVKIVKLYAPAILLGAASIGMLTGSHFILTRRNAALTAAYAAVDRGFKQYRERVREDLGEEKDKKYLYGLEKTKAVQVDETGKKTVVEACMATGTSPYSVIFHEGNPNWKSQPEYNVHFLRCVEKYMNDKLRAKGYVFLKDVLDELGFEATKQSVVVGWLYKGDGDGYIDFGIFDDTKNDRFRLYDYLVGHEGEIVLDFNVDGVIYDKI